MNIQPGKCRGNLTMGHTSRSSSGTSIGTKIATVFKVGLLVAAVAAVGNGYIYLNQKITETDRKISAGKKELHQVEREIALLRIHREELRSWSHIGPMLERFGLKLHMPQNGQVRQFSVLSPVQAAQIPLPGHVAVARQVTASSRTRNATVASSRRN